MGSHTPLLTRRVSKVSAIGLTPPGSPAQLSLRVYLACPSGRLRGSSFTLKLEEETFGRVFRRGREARAERSRLELGVFR